MGKPSSTPTATDHWSQIISNRVRTIFAGIWSVGWYHKQRDQAGSVTLFTSVLVVMAFSRHWITATLTGVAATIVPASSSNELIVATSVQTAALYVHIVITNGPKTVRSVSFAASSVPVLSPNGLRADPCEWPVVLNVLFDPTSVLARAPHVPKAPTLRLINPSNVPFSQLYHERSPNSITVPVALRPRPPPYGSRDPTSRRTKGCLGRTIPPRPVRMSFPITNNTTNHGHISQEHQRVERQ